MIILDKVQEIRKRPHICKHDQLGRQCNICDLEEEVESLKQENQELADKYNDAVYRLESDVQSLQQQLDAAKQERDKNRQEAKNERELSADIVGEREQLIIENEALKQEYERLKFELEIQISAKNVAVDVSIESMDKVESLQQQLKQAIEALEEIRGMHYIWQTQERAEKALSLIREEAGRPKGSDSTAILSQRRGPNP